MGIEAEAPHRFLPPTRTLRSGRSLESAVAVEPPTRPVPPSTSTRAVLEEEDDLFTRAAASLVEGAAAGDAHARTMPMAAIRWAYRLGRLLLALTEMSDVAKRC